MLVPLWLWIPWNNQLSSFAKLNVHMSRYLGILMSWQCSSVLPGLSLMMVPMKQFESVPRTYVRTTRAWAAYKYPWWSLWGLMAREQLGMRLSWITILMRWDSAWERSWALVCRQLTIGGASSLSCMRAGWTGCTDGTGQGRALSSLSIMTHPVRGMVEVVAEGKVNCARLVGSHTWIGSPLISESWRGVGGGGYSSWGGGGAKEDMAKGFNGL